MPWEVKKFPDGYYVVNQQTGQKKNKHPQSEEEAKAYMAALYSHAGNEVLKKKSK